MLYVFFYIIHVGVAYFCLILPGIFLFMIDRYLRFLQSRTNVRLIAARLLPCDTLELNFSKISGLEYTPSSILFVNVPLISKMQWHPFTVTSNANMDPDTLSIVIKCQGTWSHKLYQQLSSSPIDRLQVSVEGPYGPASPHFLRLVLDFFVFLWQKKDNDKREATKVQNLELSEVGEIESFTRQSVREITNVHFGGRPDLKTMLLENNKKGSAVGVMACGPRKMRHEVAKICSSIKSARNLHLIPWTLNW
ncbi:ferric reduction oxidase 4-like protein [Tanacetum coccineum]